MMNKERLEENIKSLWDIANGLASYSGVALSGKEKEVVNFFIEQAKQVQWLEKENKRYREALEKIAFKQFNVEPKRVVVKLQSIARQALEGEE